MKEEYEETEVHCTNGDWKVRIGKTSGKCSIVDPLGRERSRTVGHTMTGVFLVMELSRQPLTTLTNLDQVLVEEAAEAFQGE